MKYCPICNRKYLNNKSDVCQFLFYISCFFKGGVMGSYQVSINDVDQDIYETFKKTLKANGVSLQGKEAQLNFAKKLLFEDALMKFNENPAGWVKKNKREKQEKIQKLMKSVRRGNG